MGVESCAEFWMEQDIFYIPKGVEFNKIAISDLFRNFNGSQVRDCNELFPNLPLEDLEERQKEINVAKVKLGNAIIANLSFRAKKLEYATKKDIYNIASELELRRDLAPGIPDYELGTEAELLQEINLPPEVSQTQELNLSLEGDQISLEEIGTEFELPISVEAQQVFDISVESSFTNSSKSQRNLGHLYWFLSPDTNKY